MFNLENNFIKLFYKMDTNENIKMVVIQSRLDYISKKIDKLELLFYKILDKMYEADAL